MTLRETIESYANISRLVDTSEHFDVSVETITEILAAFMLDELEAREPPLKQIPLTLSQTAERYYGELTGFTQYRAEATHPADAKSVVNYTHDDWAKVNGVLGRTTGAPHAAIADWTRRAQADGHQVQGFVWQGGGTQRSDDS